MKLEWSDEALADLDRFAEFLGREHPSLAPIVAPRLSTRYRCYRNIRGSGGRSLVGKYRQIVLQVLGAAYVFQYRFDGARLVMLRVFHARESRE
jgi:toxin ParE1/3/4